MSDALTSSARHSSATRRADENSHPCVGENPPMTIPIERIYKSAWHLLIAAVGVYELRNHKTRLSKVLACGLIAFHADAAICDALDKPTTPQRLLQKLF